MTHLVFPSVFISILKPWIRHSLRKNNDATFWWCTGFLQDEWRYERNDFELHLPVHQWHWKYSRRNGGTVNQYIANGLYHHRYCGFCWQWYHNRGSWFFQRPPIQNHQYAHSQSKLDRLPVFYLLGGSNFRNYPERSSSWFCGRAILSSLVVQISIVGVFQSIYL